MWRLVEGGCLVHQVVCHQSLGCCPIVLLKGPLPRYQCRGLHREVHFQCCHLGGGAEWPVCWVWLGAAQDLFPGEGGYYIHVWGLVPLGGIVFCHLVWPCSGFL